MLRLGNHRHNPHGGTTAATHQGVRLVDLSTQPSPRGAGLWGGHQGLGVLLVGGTVAKRSLRRVLLLSPHSGGSGAPGSPAGAAKPQHNADVAKVRIHYPFHPFYGLEFELVHKPDKVYGIVTVFDGERNHRTVPLWMVQPESAAYALSQRAVVDARALLELSELIRPAAVYPVDFSESPAEGVRRERDETAGVGVEAEGKACCPAVQVRSRRAKAAGRADRGGDRGGRSRRAGGNR